jgi:hypothetical protein
MDVAISPEVRIGRQLSPLIGLGSCDTGGVSQPAVGATGLFTLAFFILGARHRPMRWAD